MLKIGKQKKTRNNKQKGKKGQKLPKNPPSIFNNIFFYIFLILIGYLLIGSIFQSQFNKDERPISRAITDIRDEKVQNITVDGDEIEVQLRDGTTYVTKKESQISFDEVLQNNNIDRSKVAGEINVVQSIGWEQIITPLLTILLPIIFIVFIFRQMRSASGDILSFGKSKAKMFSEDRPKITFDDVAGIKEAKRELHEIVDFLKSPEKYRKLGARTPKGILLVGPSGVGKTLLAKAIAGEANVPFFSVAGSEFMEMLVGVGSARARDLFQRAKTNQPSLIFIDEIDAIGRQRGMGIGGGHDEREQTLNQILIEMDGFDPRTEVIVIAATNRPDMLDPALIRPGRFDRKITIPMPDLKDREEIIKIHMRGKPFEDSLDIERIAKRTVGFSGADIENMLNEAAILAARENKSAIDTDDVEEASLKVTMGTERRTLQSDEERRMVAYHEAGHAVVATHLPEMDPVHRISIVARGGSLGHTSFPPERDRYNETRTRLVSLITTMLGGRAAEELEFDEMTIGAADDIEKATKLARKMVTEFGMSSLGPVSYDGKNGSIWLAKELGEAPHYSDETASFIDREVKNIMGTAYNKAKELVSMHKPALDEVANLLLEKETLTDEEYKTIIDKHSKSEPKPKNEEVSDN